MSAALGISQLVALLPASRRGLAGAVALGLVGGGASIGLLWLVGELLGGGLAATAPHALAFAAVAAALIGSRIAFLAVLGRLQQGAIYALRDRICRGVLATPLRSLEELGAGRLHAALTADVLAVGDALRTLPHVLISAATCAAGLVYLAWLSWPALLALLGLGAIGAAIYVIPARRAYALFRRARDREDALYRALRGLTDGIKELQLSAPRRAAFLAEELEPSARDLRALSVRSGDLFSATASWGAALFFVFLGLLLFGLPRLAAVEVGTLTGFAFAILYLQQPVSAIFDLAPVVGRGRIALARLAELRLAHAEPDRLAGAADAGAAPTFGELRLVGVTHTYHREQEDTSFTLGPIDLTLARGELVFLVGGNGSGKTTLGKLLTGLYTPEGGAIELDGVPVTAARREAYRQCFAAVFSDFHVFETLLGARADAETAARAAAYLAKLHLHHKVALTAGRLSTVELSSGQRKRLALLAAYLDDRPIYLFDEWAADQDPTFKAVFYTELLPELRARGKTVVVISHDDRYFHVADRVLRLDHGRLSPVPAPALLAVSTLLPQGLACPPPTGT